MDKGYESFGIAGRIALVSGGNRNIGRAIILEFAARGASVIINSRTNEAEARSVEKEAQALGAKTLVVMGTAGELKTVEEMKRRAEETFGRVDIARGDEGWRFVFRLSDPLALSRLSRRALLAPFVP